VSPRNPAIAWRPLMKNAWLKQAWFLPEAQASKISFHHYLRWNRFERIISKDGRPGQW
jgi:hypothetical protein